MCVPALFDVDFESLQPSQPVVLIDPNENAGERHTFPIRHKFMSETTARTAREVVRLLGQSFGSKNAFLVIDACLADVFESCVTRVEAGRSLCGLGQVSWLHEWIGAIVVAEQVSTTGLRLVFGGG